MSTLARRRRRRHRTMGKGPTLVGLGRRRRRRKSRTMGAMPELLGSFGRRKKASKRKGRKVCVRVGKRTYCGRPVAAPAKRRRRKR